MNHRQQIREVRIEIGLCLSALKRAKRIPDNYSAVARARYTDRLSHAVTQLAFLRRMYPDLFNPRVIQIRLELPYENSKADSPKSSTTLQAVAP